MKSQKKNSMKKPGRDNSSRDVSTSSKQQKDVSGKPGMAQGDKSYRAANTKDASSEWKN